MTSCLQQAGKWRIGCTCTYGVGVDCPVVDGCAPVGDGAMPGGRMPGGRMPGVDDVVPGAEGEALEVGDSGLVELVGVGGMLVVGRGAVVLGA